MKKIIILAMLLFSTFAYAQTNYNSIATAYVTTTISQHVVFDSSMQQGGTFTFSVLAHNGGGRAGQSDTANVKIEFYTAGGALVTSANSTYNANLPNPNAVCGNPCIDTAVPWSTLTISSTLTATQASSVAYAKVSMYGIDGSYWAGDYGPWYRAPTLQLNGGTNLLYNPEFGPYNNIQAHGWTTNPGLGACQGAWGGSNPCIANSSGTPGVSTTGLIANENGGGPSATGGTTSGQAGGYNSTMSVTNAGTGATAGAPPAPTVTGTSVSYTTRNVVSGNTTTVYRTPVTTTTYSDGTSTSSNGTEVLYQTRVATTVVTNSIQNGVLSVYSKPVVKVTPADGSATTLESAGPQTVTTQNVQQGLNFEVFRYDSKTYSCGIFGCIWDLGRRTPDTNRNNYGNPVNSGRTTNGMFIATNSDLPNNDNSIIGQNDNTVIRYHGTITAPITPTKPAGTVYRLYFYNNTDDGFKMTVNGNTIINQNSTFTLQTLASYTSSGWIDVVAGQSYSIEAWYWNVLGGFGHTLFWDYGDGRRAIGNAAYTTGWLPVINIDLTGLEYSNPTLVNVSGSSIAGLNLCCGGSSAPFNASSTVVNRVNNFINRPTMDTQVSITQIGNNNNTTVIQEGTKNNKSEIAITGNNNITTTRQTSTDHTATNFTELTITGSSNNITLEQLSTGGIKGISASVSDNNNSVNVQQKDNGNHYLELTLSGGNKTVNVLQEGSAAHMGNINLSGGATSISVTQSGPVQQHYSITHSCANISCGPITVTQGP